MRALVTGGAGFIGSHIAEGLASKGVEVRVLDDLSSGREANLSGIRVDFRTGDIRDFQAVRSAMENVDIVYHHAAFISVPRSMKEPQLCSEINVNGTLNVLEAARQLGAKRVVFASSSAVDGENPINPKVETMAPEPVSPYALTKWVGELYCEMYTRV